MKIKTIAKEILKKRVSTLMGSNFSKKKSFSVKKISTIMRSIEIKEV